MSILVHVMFVHCYNIYETELSYSFMHLINQLINDKIFAKY